MWSQTHPNQYRPHGAAYTGADVPRASCAQAATRRTEKDCCSHAVSVPDESLHFTNWLDMERVADRSGNSVWCGAGQSWGTAHAVTSDKTVLLHRLKRPDIWTNDGRCSTARPDYTLGKSSSEATALTRTDVIDGNARDARCIVRVPRQSHRAHRTN